MKKESFLRLNIIKVVFTFIFLIPLFTLINLLTLNLIIKLVIGKLFFSLLFQYSLSEM